MEKIFYLKENGNNCYEILCSTDDVYSIITSLDKENFVTSHRYFSQVSVNGECETVKIDMPELYRIFLPKNGKIPLSEISLRFDKPLAVGKRKIIVR